MLRRLLGVTIHARALQRSTDSRYGKMNAHEHSLMLPGQLYFYAVPCLWRPVNVGMHLYFPKHMCAGFDLVSDEYFSM